MKAVIIGILVTVGIIGSFILIGNLASKDDATDPSSESDKVPPVAVNEDPNAIYTEHVRGNLESDVEFYEYLDFQCPFCGQYYPLIEQVFQEYGDRVKFVTRSYPITTAHPNALVAHRAAEAAGAQGKFFEMHDLLFERQQLWSNSDNPKEIMDQFATELELDMDRYNAVYNDPATLAFINAQAKGGADAGVTSTPTFALNRVILKQPPTSLVDFQELLDEALAEQAPAQ